MKVNLISLTENAEELIAYCARVSSSNQDNPNFKRLIKYCIKHRHWSPFEMADMTVEIETTRAISAQILRHRSFVFQEFSQRYAKAQAFETVEARRQDETNRQNSVDDMSEEDKEWWAAAQASVHDQTSFWYEQALAKGIAKEQARMILPMSTKTKLYMKGSVRSWIHYLEVRNHEDTQLEHRAIAQEIEKIFLKQFPTVWGAWRKVNTFIGDKDE